MRVPGQVAMSLIGLIAASGVEAAPPAPDGEHLVIRGVALGDGLHADLHVRVFASVRARCDDRAVLVVHGAVHNAESWSPFAAAVLASPWWDRGACRVYAIDLPGHGASGLPAGAPFGDLGITHYATAVRGVLSALAGDGIEMTAILGHSMGGLVVQRVQADLVGDGTDLRAAFGVTDAVLMASSLPAAVRGEACSDGRPDEARLTLPPGDVVALPDPVWRALFFSDLTGHLAWGAPDLETVARYNAGESAEALAAIVDEDAAPDLPPGLFDGDRARLTVVAHADDPFARPARQRCLQQYLSAAADTEGFVVLDHPGAVHDAHVSSPDEVVRALRRRDALP